MLNGNRACTSVGLAIAIFGWIANSNGQQTPETKSASPPPSISFRDSSAPAIGARAPVINGQALAPLQPSTHDESPIPEAPSREPAKSILDKNLNWSGEAPLRAPPESNASEIYVDSQVQPASHLEFTPSAPNSAAGLVLQAFDLNQWNAALPGKARSMTDLLAATNIESRPELIRSYWGVFEKWARRVTAQIEADQLAELRAPDSAIERDILATANALAKARIIESEMEMEAAQQILAQFVPTPSEEMLPLANDLPLVDEYVTHYAAWGQQFGFNPRLEQINQSLPKSLQIIQARADAATQSRQVVRQSIQAFNQNQLPLGSAVEAIRMCRESQQDFIRAVHRYNQDIAEYALTVAPFGQPAEQVVAMLIKQPNSPASVTPTIAGSATASRPQTFMQSVATPVDPLEQVPKNSPTGNPPTLKSGGGSFSLGNR